MLKNLNGTWDQDDEPKELPSPKKDLFREQVYEMWEAGIRDLQEIRQETGYTTRYIRELLRKRGYDATTTIPRSVEDMNGIVLDYRTMPVRAVLKKWKISNNTLYSILDERGEPIKRKNNRVRTQHMDHAVNMYMERRPLKEITAETGIHAAQLYEELETRDIGLRTHDKMKSLPVERAIEMYNSGSTIIDIQIETGITLAQLYKVLSERQIPKRRGSDFDVRLERAVQMYLDSKPNTAIYAETKIGAPVLYRALQQRGLNLRKGKAQGDLQAALELYDKGSSFNEIHRVARVTLAEVLHALRKRGGNLRTGLGMGVTPAHLKLAVQMYQANKNVDDVEIDTFVSRTMLYTELKKKGITIRP